MFGGIEVEFAEDGSQQLYLGHQRIQNQRGFILRPELFEQRAAEGGFTRPHLAGNLDEAFSLAYTEQQMIESLAMLVAKEKKPRIGRNIERGFFKAVEFVVHNREKWALFRQKASHS